MRHAELENHSDLMPWLLGTELPSKWIELRTWAQETLVQKMPKILDREMRIVAGKDL